MIPAPHWAFLATGTAMIAVTAAEGKPAADSGCSVTRILADGRQVAAAMPPGLTGVSGTRVEGGSGAAWASSRVSGRSGSSASSSSSSSASSSGRGSFAQSTASHTDESGRTITIVRDGRSCRVTIDDRTIGED